ncbi:MAG: hypothetical protein HeimC3_53660 [Candidatus Heimdallarchaeota archaeon LC_3]|nr:MAG: hypothetical protein HeimC3_53660 [Candidatus Heimdallarchaeota archaeon LC_3]
MLVSSESSTISLMSAFIANEINDDVAIFFFLLYIVIFFLYSFVMFFIKDLININWKNSYSSDAFNKRTLGILSSVFILSVITFLVISKISIAVESEIGLIQVLIRPQLSILLICSFLGLVVYYSIQKILSTRIKNKTLGSLKSLFAFLFFPVVIALYILIQFLLLFEDNQFAYQYLASGTFFVLFTIMLLLDLILITNLNYDLGKKYVKR